MWACPHCEKAYTHQSSLHRHVLNVHGSETKRKDAPVSNGKAEKKCKTNDADAIWRKKCQTAWNKVIIEAVHKLKEEDDYSHLDNEDLCKKEHLEDLTIPAVMQMVESRLDEADCLRKSQVLSALEGEKKKLMESGMAEWEATLMARTNRKFLLAEQIASALKSEEEEEVEEEAEEEETYKS